MLKVNVRTDRSGHWLEQSILHLLEEAASDRAGSDDGHCARLYVNTWLVST